MSNYQLDRRLVAARKQLRQVHVQLLGRGLFTVHVHGDRALVERERQRLDRGRLVQLAQDEVLRVHLRVGGDVDGH